MIPKHIYVNFPFIQTIVLTTLMKNWEVSPTISFSFTRWGSKFGFWARSYRFQLLLASIWKFLGSVSAFIQWVLNIILLVFSKLLEWKWGLWAERIEGFWPPFPQYLEARVWDRKTVFQVFCEGVTEPSKHFCKWKEQNVLGVPRFVWIFFWGLWYWNQRTVIHLSILNKMKATEMCLSYLVPQYLLSCFEILHKFRQHNKLLSEQ